MPKRRHWQDHAGPILDSVKGFDVIDCEFCGFKHIVPIPTAEELDNVYREEYYSAEKPLYIERQREDVEWWNMVYRDRYDTFEQHLPPQRRRILDIGSGPGFFLLHGKQRGWETMGVEPSIQAANHARSLGLEIVEDFLDEHVASSIGKFDVVHMNTVLEHIPDPRGMLLLAHSLLNPGGIICVVVPNDYNPFQYALRTVCGYDPWWVDPPHHINYFDFNSLSGLLAANRFEEILRETTFPIDIFLLMGDNYVGNDSLGRQCHNKRKTLEQNLARAGLNHVKRRLYRALAANDLGREIFIIAYKKS